MSAACPKRRKVDGPDGDGSVAAESIRDVVAGLQAQMARMHNEMDAHRRENTAMRKEIDDLKEASDHTKRRLLDVAGLERRCKYLEAQCKSLRTYAHVLGRDHNWEYSAPYIASSYWTDDQGFDDQYATNMKVLLGHIKEATVVLRNEDMDGSLSRSVPNGKISISLGRNVDNDTVLRHDDMLTPHWKELTDSMQAGRRCAVADTFHLCNVQLTEEVINMLVPALARKNFVRIYFDHVEFVDAHQGTMMATELIEETPQLHEFGWSQIHGTLADVRDILEAIKQHSCIRIVRMNESIGQNDNGYEILQSLLAMGRTFHMLDLGSNNIAAHGRTHLSDYLATNPHLGELTLSHNELNDNDADLIATALGANTNLTFLDLHGNNITRAGEISLGRAIFDDATLNSAANSNHTCYIKGVRMGRNDNGSFDPSKSRSRKIYELLSEKHLSGFATDLDSEFVDDGEGLNLAPHILSCIHRYGRISDLDGYAKPFSIFYDILRSWRMPELYQTKMRSFRHTSKCNQN